MNFKVVLAVVLAVVMVGGGAYYFVSSQSGVDTSYAELLPETTLAVFGVDSPAELFRQIDPAKYPTVFEDLKKESTRNIGFDVTDPKAYGEKGLDLNKPAGFAFLDIVKGGYEPVPVFAAFLGVSDWAKFDAFVRENVKKAKLEVAEKQVASFDCRLVKAGEQVLSIYTFQKGYGFFYFGGGMVENLEKSFEDNMGAGKLSANEDFKNSLAGLADGAEMYAYAHIREGLKVWKKTHVDSAVVFEQFMPEGILALSIGGKITGKDPHMSAYTLADPELVAKYKATGNAKDLLAKFPENPIVCATGNSNVDETWKKFKEDIDKALTSEILRSMIPELDNMLEQLPVKNIDGLLKMANDGLKKEMGVDVDLEKDMILNLEGNSAFGLYSLPTPKKMDFDAVIAVKLKDGKKMADLLSNIIKAVEKKMGQQLPLIEGKAGDAVIYTVDVEALGDPSMKALSPTFGVAGEYLLVSVKKDMLSQIAQGETSGMLKSIDAKVAKAMGDGNIAAGYVNLSTIIKYLITNKLIPDKKENAAFLSHMQNITWVYDQDKTGWSALITMNSDEDFLAAMLQFAEGQIKEQKARMKKWREEMEKQDKEMEKWNKPGEEEGGEEEE